MKTIIKEINLLDIEDIEEALSSYIGKKISISDVSCSLVHCVTESDEPDGIYLEFWVGDQEEAIESLEVFWDDEKNCHGWKGKVLDWDNSWPSIEELFNFDISAFKSFWSDGLAV